MAETTQGATADPMTPHGLTLTVAPPGIEPGLSCSRGRDTTGQPSRAPLTDDTPRDLTRQERTPGPTGFPTNGGAP